MVAQKIPELGATHRKRRAKYASVRYRSHRRDRFGGRHRAHHRRARGPRPRPIRRLGASPERRGGLCIRHGDLGDPQVLRVGASRCDGVIHLAFGNDVNNFAKCVEEEALAVETFGAALEGSGKALVIASGTPAVPGQRLERSRPGADRRPRWWTWTQRQHRFEPGRSWCSLPRSSVCPVGPRCGRALRIRVGAHRCRPPERRIRLRR